jgi:hypothetical protein
MDLKENITYKLNDFIKYDININEIQNIHKIENKNIFFEKV